MNHTAHSMDTAPKDGSMICLLVEPDSISWTPFNDSNDPFWTIGFNNFPNTMLDEWEIAGWDWSHDCFTSGGGRLIGWAPFDPGKLVEVLNAQA